MSVEKNQNTPEERFIEWYADLAIKMEEDLKEASKADDKVKKVSDGFCKDAFDFLNKLHKADYMDKADYMANIPAWRLERIQSEAYQSIKRRLNKEKFREGSLIKILPEVVQEIFSNALEGMRDVADFMANIIFLASEGAPKFQKKLEEAYFEKKARKIGAEMREKVEQHRYAIKARVEQKKGVRGR